MSNTRAFFACKPPHQREPKMYACEPCDETQADLVWGDYAAESVHYYRRDALPSDFKQTLCKTDPIPSDIAIVEKSEYIGMVENARRTIAETRAKKIVLSRSLVVQLPEPFDVLAFYKRLCSTFPTAFVYLFNANGACWMGATPELLLKQDQQHIHTMSLAGTRWTNEGKHTAWTDKEREEQAWVTTFLREELRNLGVQELNESEPKTIQAGHLQHLCTELNGRLPVEVTPLDAARRLHPTPAVCGYPRDVARTFIESNESHNRSYYAGYIGMSEGQKAEFYVNLRCMRVFSDCAQLFAGGGITADSNPGTEWEETEQKLDVLRQLMHTV